LLQDGELVRGPFGVRKPGAQLERVPQMSCGLARRVSPPGGIGRDPEVPDGPRRVAAVLEVIGEEWRRLARLLCERGLCPFGGLPMQPRPAARRARRPGGMRLYNTSR